MISKKSLLVAEIRVGQEYKGSSGAFLPPQFRRFDVAFEGKVSPVAGRIGDRPAVKIRPPGEGLVVLIHETRDRKLDWETSEKFGDFVRHKDAEWTLEAHTQRGFPNKNVTEVYSRYAKSLVAVGNGVGDDVVTGMVTEIVALENPYTGNSADGVLVQVLYQGKPRVDEQVEIFEKAPDNSVRVFTMKTDSAGRANIPVRPGHRYMVDSVVLREPPADLVAATGAQWESLWANLTFAVPGN